MADIKISKGYRFTDAAGAGDLLTRMNNPIPDGLVGILAPESGQWWAVLTYKNIGYVKNADKDRIDQAAILKSVSDRAQRQNEERTLHGLPPINSVDWKLSPAFDAKTHTLEWAIQVKTQSAEVINHTICLFGRQGVLEATVVEPYQSLTDLAPLKQLMKNISFKSGQLYTDYQKGDTVAGIGLAGLISGADDSTPTPKNAVAKTAGIWSWYAYVAVGVLAGGCALLLRVAIRRRAHKAPRYALTASNGKGAGETTAHEHAPAAVLASAAVGNGHAKPGSPKAESIKPGDKVVGKEAYAMNGSNQRGARRRKIFDYHRFYTDTVLKLSSGAYTGIPTPSNGHANGRPLGRGAETKPQAQQEINQTLVQAHLDLIANQKDLIEEQKRLMIQQAKLIEEKSKLIAEKSQLLDRQTELFERDIL